MLLFFLNLLNELRKMDKMSALSYLLNELRKGDKMQSFAKHRLALSQCV